MMLNLVNRSGKCGRVMPGVALVALLAMATPAAPVELAPAFKACGDAPTAQCVFGLAADTIASDFQADGDQLLSHVERPALLRLARETIVGLAKAGASERAVELIRSTGRTAEERAAILLDVAQLAPRLVHYTAVYPLLQESIRTLDPFPNWPALALLPAPERSAGIARWLDITRLCEDAGLHNLVLVSVNAARRALTTPAFEHLEEAGQTELALAVVRAALAAGDPELAEDASSKVSGSSLWSAARVEIATEYANQDQTSPALTLIEHFDTATRKPAIIAIFQSFMRRGWLDMARSSLLSLGGADRARALADAAESTKPDQFLAVLNVVDSQVQSIARAALVRRYLREGSYNLARQQATDITEPWVRLNALAAVTTQSALAGDTATTRDARYWLESMRGIDVDRLEYFAAAFVGAFSRVALGDLDSRKRDLETLRTRLEAVSESAMMLADPQALDLLSLNLDAFRMAVGEEPEVLGAAGASAPALFSRAFAAGTAFGMSGSGAGDLVAHALEAISSVEDAKLRIGLLVTLGHQMQSRELVVGFRKSQ